MKYSVVRTPGFTLIEAIITVALISIVAVLSIPLGDTIKNERASSSIQELISSLNLARSEAITRGIRVTVCKRAENSDPNINQCDADVSKPWTNGWIVFADTTVGAAPDIDAVEDTILRVSAPLSPTLTLTTKTTNPLVNYVSYTSSGMSRRYSDALQMGSLFLCDPNEGYVGSSARRIVISATGKVRVEKTKGYSAADAADVPAICST